jgi:hypothetical protein
VCEDTRPLCRIEEVPCRERVAVEGDLDQWDTAGYVLDLRPIRRELEAAA